MKFETILYEVDKGILTITLDRPERLNAFNNRMRDEVISALDAADADDNVKAIILINVIEIFNNNKYVK